MTQKVKSFIYFACFVAVALLYNNMQEDSVAVKQDNVKEIAKANLELNSDETALLLDTE